MEILGPHRALAEIAERILQALIADGRDFNPAMWQGRNMRSSVVLAKLDLLLANMNEQQKSEVYKGLYSMYLVGRGGGFAEMRLARMYPGDLAMVQREERKLYAYYTGAVSFLSQPTIHANDQVTVPLHLSPSLSISLYLTPSPSISLHQLVGELSNFLAGGAGGVRAKLKNISAEDKKSWFQRETDRIQSQIQAERLQGIFPPDGEIFPYPRNYA